MTMKRWNDIRDEHVAAAGGAEAVRSGKESPADPGARPPSRRDPQAATADPTRRRRSHGQSP